MQTHHHRNDQTGRPEVIPFSVGTQCDDAIVADDDEPRRFALTALPDSAGHVLAAIENMSRRLEDLARELNCLGYFEDDDDLPRAA
jgi:hypothetical protein